MHFTIKVITLLLQYSSGSVIYFAFPSIRKSWLLSASSILLLFCLALFYFMYFYYTQQFSVMPVVLPVVPRFIFFYPLI